MTIALRHQLPTFAAASVSAFALMLGTATAATPTSITVGGDSTPADVPFDASLAPGTQAEFYTDFGVDTICDDVDIEGYIAQGASVENGETIGAITDAQFRNCLWVAGLNYPLVMDLEGPGWDIVATQQVTAGDPVPVQITGIELYKTSTGSPPYACELRLTGGLDAVITPGYGGVDATVEFTGGFGLVVQAYDGMGNPAVSTCMNQLLTGDQYELFADFVLDAPGVISHS